MQPPPVVRRAMRPLDIVAPEHAIGVRGTLYDLRGFTHPGGNTFVKLATGLDATALFETHHINIAAANKALSKLPVLGTYNETHSYNYNSFFKIREKAYRLFPTRKSRRMQDSDARRLYIVIAVTASIHIITLLAPIGSLMWVFSCILAAFLNSFCGAYGHNAIHRLHPLSVLLDWNGLSSYEWLFEHILSHHMQVNTEYDHDSIAMEPFLQWLPARPRCIFHKYPVLAKHLIYAIAEISVAIQGIFVHRTRFKACLDSDLPFWLRLAPFVFLVRIGSYIFVQGWLGGLYTALFTIFMAGYLFAYLAHLSHSFGGDARPDFLRHQLINTKDMYAANVSGDILLFLDRQTLHHLFPSVDHTRLSNEARQVLNVEEYMKPYSLQQLNVFTNKSFIDCQTIKKV